MKGLQRKLEVEEGKHRSTEELVFELSEVGEEVQVVDSHQRKVEQLEEKLTELGGKVREGRAQDDKISCLDYVQLSDPGYMKLQH